MIKLNKNKILLKQIIWCLRTVDNNQSYNSNANIGKILEKMFHDSQIAAAFNMSYDKTRYYLNWTLGPHFRDLLIDAIKHSIVPSFTILFDESMNDFLQKKQMDIHVRYWDNGKVITRYIHSEFLGKSCATDILTCFNKLDAIISLKNMHSISMDGPNVNIAFNHRIKVQCDNRYDHGLMWTGTCFLHILHNAIKDATHKSGWGVGKFLTALYTLFHSVPARVADYQKITECYLKPMKFCPVRWGENIKPAKRALRMIESLQKYVLAINQKKVKHPETTSYETVRQFVFSPNPEAKLQFFIFLVDPLEAFLVKYQDDKPMMPYMANDINSLVAGLANTCIRNTVIEAHLDNVLAIEFDKVENHKIPKYIKIGHHATTLMKQALEDEKMSVAEVSTFKTECGAQNLILCEKIKAKNLLCLILQLKWDVLILLKL